MTIDGEECLLEVDMIPEAIWSHWMDKGNPWTQNNVGVVLLYSIISYDSFLSLQETWKHLLENRPFIDTKAQPDRDDGTASGLDVTESLPMILIGTKSDLADKREVEYRQGVAFAEALGCSFLEVSSMNGSNVARAAFDLVRTIRDHRVRVSQRQQSSLPPSGSSRAGLRRKLGKKCSIS